MSLTLLLDLDDTLLNNDSEVFLPVYLERFAGHVAPLIDPDLFVRALLDGTHEMMSNMQPDRTLKQVFESVFYPMVGVSEAEFIPFAEEFYQDIYPNLEELTSPVPEAVDFINQALGRGYHLTIATNPLFPRTAIMQRLEWAGLDPQKYPFDLVTSYENFHFSKPNPAYYLETMARLGWPDGPVIVVGDDMERDIQPASHVGLPTFWIPKDDPDGMNADNSNPGSDNLLGVFDWLDREVGESLFPDYETVPVMVETMRSTPAALGSMCSELTPYAWTKQPAPQDWSPAEIICHLRDVEREVNLPRIRKVLDENNPFLPGEDTDPWANERRYIIQDGRAALDSFVASRIELLNILENLSADNWQRPARHAIFGITTLQEIVRIITGHDRLHVRQIHRDLCVNSAHRLTELG